MSDLLHAVLLGIVQGLTEFLPVSSSGHLLILPWILGLSPFGLTFDVFVHLGTLGAVIAVFFQDFRELAYRVLRVKFKPLEGRNRLPFVGPLLLGTIPAGLVGFLFKDCIESAWRHPLPVALNLAVFGAILLWADLKGSQERDLAEVGYRDALLIGLAQALALAPGVSRSGITITAALFLGLTRGAAARFSFLLATPLIAGAGLLQALRLLSGDDPQAPSWGILLVGGGVAFLTGWLGIRFLLRYLDRGSVLPFAVYRFVLAAVIVVWTQI